MLTKNEIFSFYTAWNEKYLPQLITRLDLDPKNERQKQALFRVFDSLIWGIAESRDHKTHSKNFTRRVDAAEVTLESADIPKVSHALSAVVGIAVSSFEREFGDERADLLPIRTAAVQHAGH